MNSYAVAEKFVSINGEGKHAGELAVFLRFRGCNLACGFCDTKWANTAAAPAVRMTTDELVAYVRETGVRNVTLTGGEPLLQPGIDELITALGALGYRVEIETNGSVSLQPFASLSFRPNTEQSAAQPMHSRVMHPAAMQAVRLGVRSFSHRDARHRNALGYSSAKSRK